jgi:hypothetical protein
LRDTLLVRALLVISPARYQPETEPDYVAKLLRYTLSLGAHSCLSPGHLDLFDTMASIAQGE